MNRKLSVFHFSIFLCLAATLCAQPDCLRTQRHGIESPSQYHPIVWVSTGDTLSVDTDRNGQPITTVDGFWISCEEITNDLWSWYFHKSWDKTPADSLPVTGKSLQDIDIFLDMLSKSTSLTWRLPTREEWLFAFRGGIFGDDRAFSGSNRHILVAWSNGNSSGNLHPVGKRIPNDLDIYDMSGNAAEMVTVGDSVEYIGGCYLDDFGKWRTENGKRKTEKGISPCVDFPIPPSEARGFRVVSHQPLKFNKDCERVYQ